MRYLIGSVFAAFALLAAPAQAQTGADRTADARAIINSCVASPHLSGYANAEAVCACGTGYMSARTTDRQFAIIARVSPHFGDEAGMQAEVRQLVSEGVSPEEVVDVGQLMVELGAIIDLTCDRI